MHRFLTLLLAGVVLATAPARADEAEENEAPPADFDAYQELHESTCVGPADGKLAKPDTFTVGDYTYTVTGARLAVVRNTKRTHAELRFGLVGAIKDDAADTRQNLDDYLAKFKAADVDAIVVNGDTADDETDITSILGRLAASGLPVYAIIGNQESRSTWNRALRDAHKANRNVINLDLVRAVDLGAVGLVTLPGYYDKKYTHAMGSCVYTGKHIAEVVDLVKSLPGTPVLVSHGPPKQQGKLGLDFVPSAGNTGDPDIATVLASAKIPVGFFGHILEAGGRATDLSGKKELKPNTFVEGLYVNVGSANSLPWRMNAGPESYGLAMLVSIEGRKAKFETFRSPRRELPPE